MAQVRIRRHQLKRWNATQCTSSKSRPSFVCCVSYSFQQIAGSVGEEPEKENFEPVLSDIHSCLIARSNSNWPWIYYTKWMPSIICADFFLLLFLLSQIYGLFPSIPSTYSGYPHQVSEDDNSCGFQNSDQPDVFTAFRVKIVDS